MCVSVVLDDDCFASPTISFVETSASGVCSITANPRELGSKNCNGDDGGERFLNNRHMLLGGTKF